MLYYLFTYLDKAYDVPGAGMFQYISFRASCSAILSLIISLLYGKRIINYLRTKQIGETIRELGLEGQSEKAGTPTMGGLIILGAILIPTLLFARLDNVYVLLMLFATIWLGLIGFIDDYIKVFKKNKEGLAGKFKILGQVIAGIVIGCVLYFNGSVVIREKLPEPKIRTTSEITAFERESSHITKFSPTPAKSLKTTIPFFKNNEFDYSVLIGWAGEKAGKYAWIIFIVIVTFIITAISNGANLTDGMDGLATGTSAIIGITLGLLAWVSGNIVFADYLNIMYIPRVGELVIYISAFVGACTGFLWYNSYPAQVFMGDTGSLALGGAIAAFAFMIRKEFLIPILCGIFIIENLSVVMQVAWFKFTKKRYGEGRRIFLMAPLHHHYQKLGYHESKIVLRFLIVNIMLAILTFITLKIR
ncbi:MAG TPA: phospho-N-acetylmuramoyl-pentapeptide-transferase [Bacteroidales bacterium]|nr:phospho-N-acetylmuramoyl-pentapeptide-transferase [Bacteroidales bacterium]HPT02750.1 phospho-N-acetylmuramoyl-pentapeptide-transferase [Bacteroidales bacterium]